MQVVTDEKSQIAGENDHHTGRRHQKKQSFPQKKRGKRKKMSGLATEWKVGGSWRHRGAFVLGRERRPKKVGVGREKELSFEPERKTKNFPARREEGIRALRRRG